MFCFLGFTVYQTSDIISRAEGAKVRDDVIEDLTKWDEVSLNIEPLALALSVDNQSLAVCFSRDNNIFAKILDVPSIISKV